jgi:hypothetical protein
MRQDGHLIETAPASASVVRYILIRDSNGAAPPSPARASQDWYTAQTGKPRAVVLPEKDDLPLFGQAVR